MKKIQISISQQTLTLFSDQGKMVCQYSISSAKNGMNSLKNSGGTPLGQHIIRAKIGSGQPINTVFIGRRPTGEIFSPQLQADFPQRDWVLSRILWLSGLEKGINRLGERDTMQRYIYIHGTPDSEPMGKPLSHGCIRMRNQDVIELFDQVSVGTRIDITA